MDHTCHAIGCQKHVPPEMLMCYKHWKMVPRNLQQSVWRHYRNGQCDDKRPSREWINAANVAVRHVADIEKRAITQGDLFA